jgi:hypothetical protein
VRKSEFHCHKSIDRNQRKKVRLSVSMEVEDYEGRLMEEDSMKKLLIGTAVLFAALPFTFDGVTPTVSKANAVIGRPLTPGSVAGVHRRAMRRTYGVGANLGYHPVARAAAVGAVAAGAAAAGAGYYGAGYGGWGGGWGGWGWNRPLYSYAGATPGMGGYGFGMGAFGCYSTFDYSTGWNQFCPGTGFVFGTGYQHQ